MTRYNAGRLDLYIWRLKYNMITSVKIGSNNVLEIRCKNYQAKDFYLQLLFLLDHDWKGICADLVPNSRLSFPLFPCGSPLLSIPRPWQRRRRRRRRRRGRGASSPLQSRLLGLFLPNRRWVGLCAQVFPAVHTPNRWYSRSELITRRNESGLVRSRILCR